MKYILWGSLVALAACGSEAKVCPPGQQVECSCSNGESSFQVCSPDGTSFGECDCPDDPPPTTPTMSQGAGGTGGEGGSPTTASSIDGGNGPGPGPTTVNTGGSPGTGGGTVVSCYEEGDALSLNGFSLPTQGDLGLCTAAQIDLGYTACLAPSADEASCNTFINNNVACSDCLFSSEDYWAPIVAVGSVVIVNSSACEALEQNKPTCTDSTLDALICVLTSCSTCTTAQSEADCLFEAETGICSSVVGNVSASCESVLAGGSAACDAPTFQALYDEVATRICGG